MGRTVPQTSVAPRVPDAGSAVIALLNSRPYAIFGDRLDDSDYLAGMLRDMGTEAAELTPAARDDVRVIRDSLARILLADPDDVDREWDTISERTSSATLDY